MHPPEWYADHQVDLRVDTTVTAIDRRAHELVAGDRNRLRYDKLLLTTGSTPRQAALDDRCGQLGRGQ